MFDQFEEKTVSNCFSPFQDEKPADAAVSRQIVFANIFLSKSEMEIASLINNKESINVI